jgi:hypothetical protein
MMVHCQLLFLRLPADAWRIVRQTGDARTAPPQNVVSKPIVGRRGNMLAPERVAGVRS